MSTNIRNEDGSLNIQAIITAFSGPEGAPPKPVESPADGYDPTFGLSVEEMIAAGDIAQFVGDNGRVSTDDNGYFNRESFISEVSFEASERGYDAATAETMGKYMADHASWVNEA